MLIVIIIKALITDLNKKIIQNVMYFSWYRKKIMLLRFYSNDSMLLLKKITI